MKHYCLVILILTLPISLWAQKTIKIDNKISKTAIINHQDNDFSIELSFGELFLERKTARDTDFNQLHINGLHKNYSEVGNAQLPVYTRLIEIPQNATYSIESSYSSEEIIDLDQQAYNFPIFPTQASVSKSSNEIEFAYNPAYYSKKTFQKEELVQIEILGTMRGRQIARLKIAPLQYHPQKNKLKLLNDIKVTVKFSPSDNTKTIENSEPFDQIFSKLANYSPTLHRSNTTALGYLIIADRMFEATLQPFIQWKQQKGFWVTVAYTDQPEVGQSTTSIKNYIESLYLAGNEDKPVPTYLLLVGDVEQVPAFNGITDSHVSDLYYVTFDGTDDYFPELFYGRFSAKTIEDLENQIAKTLEYEKFQMPDPAYLKNAVLVAGVDATFAPTHGNGQVNYGTGNYFNTENGINTYSYLYPESGSSSTQIIKNISDGVGFANYTAHCNENGWAEPSFVVNDVAALQNEHKYAFMIGNCCLSARYNYSESFAEVVVRAKNKGAVGYIGGSNNTLWDEDFYWGVGATSISANPVYDEHLGAFDRLFHTNSEAEEEWRISAGQMINGGNLAVTESGTGYVRYYWEIYHLMGDPSLVPMLGQIDAQTVEIPSEYISGSGNVQISTETNSYISVNYNNINITAGSDNNGIFEFTPDIVEPGSYFNIVVSKQNRIPFIDSVLVIAPDGPYITVREITYVDENDENSIDYGETIRISVKLKNVGVETATNLTTELIISDIFVEAITNSKQIADIVHGTEVEHASIFELKISPESPNGHTVNAKLLITDNQGNNWAKPFIFKINAAHITASFSDIDDSNGNSNHYLEPGESAIMKVNLINTGGSRSKDLVINISSSNKNVIPDNPNYTASTLNASDTAFLEIALNAAETAEKFELYNIVIQTQNQNTWFSDTITHVLGLQIENWETNSFGAHDWLHSEESWTIQGNTVFEGNFAARSAKIADNQTTKLSLYLDVKTDGEIRFHKKISSEAEYDFLHFYIDNQEMGSWSGLENQWEQQRFAIAAGRHEISWVYKKDVGLASGDDCAYIDQIEFPPFTHVNFVPEFLNMPDTAIIRGQEYHQEIAVSDRNPNDVLTLNLQELPAWITAQMKQDTILLQGNAPANYSAAYPVLIYADDGENTSKLSYNLHVTAQPEFTSDPITEATEDVLYTYPITATDADADQELSISTQKIPGWLNFSAQNQTLSGSPDDDHTFGANQVILALTDGLVTVYQEFNINVENINDVPYFKSSIGENGIATIREDETFTYTVYAEDDDIDATLKLTLNTPADWLSISKRTADSWYFRAKPLQEHVGTHTVILALTDNVISNPVLQKFTLTVENVNDNPEFVSEPTTALYSEQNYFYKIIVTDEDIDDEVNISVTTKPDWLNFTSNQDSVYLSGKPTSDDVGEHTVTLLAEDTNDGTTTQEFPIEVILSTNIEQVNQSTEIAVYPNPIKPNGQLHISGSDGDIKQINLLDATGKQIIMAFSSDEIKSQKLKLRNIESGQYLLVIYTKTQKITKNIIIKP